MDDSEDKNSSLNLIADYGTDSDSEDAETQSNIGNEDSEAVEHHEMVLKNNIINACAHGPLSKNETPRDNVEVTRHMIIDNMESGVVEYEVSEYRDVDFDSDSDSSSEPSISSDSDVESVKDAEEMSNGEDIGSKAYTAKPEIPKVPGELGLDDLPPIEDLAISLQAQQTVKIGTIASIVDRLVIVRSVLQKPAVDIDTVLFLEKGAKALGKVFDVFGPITEPHYCVRFNSAEHVRARGVAPGVDVYIAPASDHTNYVFLSELMKAKGSDASWLNDLEPPPSQVEYSDDEEERVAIKIRKDFKMARQMENGEQAANGETSVVNPPSIPIPVRKTLEAKRSQRPSESSSRFGSGPSRGRNPFSTGIKRHPNVLPRPVRPWVHQPDLTIPPPRIEPTRYSYVAPFNPPLLQSNFCTAPPPFIGSQFQFGMNPRMPPPTLPPMNVAPTLPPMNVPSAIPPMNISSAIPPMNISSSIPPMNISPAFPPMNLPPVLPAMSVPPPFRQSASTFGSAFCNIQTRWIGGMPPPPPPGT